MTPQPADTPTPTTIPAHPLEPMRRVLRVAVVGAVVLATVAALVGWAIDGQAGLLGALLGVGLPVAFFGVTVVTALVTLRLSPSAMGAVVLVSWMVKVVALIGVLALMDTSDAWSRPVFAVAFGVTVPAWLGLEAWMVIKTRQPYTAPSS